MVKQLIYIFSISAAVTLLFIVVSIFDLRYISDSETAVIELKTIVCGNCAETIKKALSNDPGIISADVSLRTKSVSIRYDKKKTNVGNFESYIVNSGYDANDKIADSTAYRNLSNCCQIWGDEDDYLKLRENKEHGCKGGCCSN